MANLRNLPTGVVKVPVTFAGVSSRMLISRSFGITFAHADDAGSVLLAPADGRLRTSHGFTVHLRNDLAMP